VLLEGLRRLEYRGYDSAGLATLSDSTLHVRKRVGGIAALAELVAAQPMPGSVGIGHTRWATHGGVTEANAHPHIGGNNLVAVVHNGVIENYAALRRHLQDSGVVFNSQTDTEVIAHLIAHYYRGDLVAAVAQTLPHLTGTYGLAIISPRHPGMIVGARLGSPLVIGVSHGETFLASDPGALVGFTDQVVYLRDRQICILTPQGWDVRDNNGVSVPTTAERIDWDATAADKAGFPHFTLKEIYEQPEALENALRGRLDGAGSTAKLGGLNVDPDYLRKIDRIVLVGCGTSYHAALVGEYWIEELARIPVEVEYASEFRYRNAPLPATTLVVVLSQSGETADTLIALRESKRRGFRTLGLCNVVGSSIAREVDGGIYLHAGPEIGVASTKTFNSQLVALLLLALYLGRLRCLSAAAGTDLIRALRGLPDLVRKTLKVHDVVRRVAARYVGAADFLFLGRLTLYPIALEGALKLKELSYIHAEGYPAGEMKHGPLALVEPATPSVFLLPDGDLRNKIMSNVEEVRSRSGPVIAIATEGDREIAGVAEEVLYVPPAAELLQPIIAVIPLQLLAYEIAALRGSEIDKPRNLAKSVTVE
jgi:glucosamine--fructose-6-phosphate aminotransferase (isomerizing)